MGLFLAACLHILNISCLVLEKRSCPRPGSRSLGIHPVSLELFQRLQMAERLVEEGIIIKKGHAFSNTQKIGSLSFEKCPKPFNFVLALPQVRTEEILEEHLADVNDQLLIRGANVTDIKQQGDHVAVSFIHEGTLQTIHASFLIGCDGKSSTVRVKENIPFEGSSYPDTYVMGDFTDNTELGSDVAIFLCREGLIESFPLPENYRRWVIKTASYHSSVTPEQIADKVRKRIGHRLTGTGHRMLSSFGVQRYLAKPMVNERVILAGDAAHVISPIGGQGLNLGWLGAWDLSQTLNTLFTKDMDHRPLLQQFQSRRMKAAKNAIRRAEMNMRLGRKTSYPWLRNNLVSLMLNTPLSRLMSQFFTMRGIERWII